jgi:3-oxoacyl-[acyl-carrier protein] reductase
MDFTNKIALITGGAGGIGFSIAEAFSALGATVAIVDLSDDRLRFAAQRLSQMKGRAVTIEADITDSEAIVHVLTRVSMEFGKLDILVNNVGSSLGVREPFGANSPEIWEQLYDINLKHVLMMSHGCLDLLKRAGRGSSLINISTIEAFRGHPLAAAYSAFKAGVTGFTRSLALELGPYGIRVNAIAPETTETEAVRASSWLPASDVQQISHWIPLGRFGRAEDIASCAVFLASDLSAWVTGTTIHVDGGALAAAGWVRTVDGRWTHRPTISGTQWPPPKLER